MKRPPLRFVLPVLLFLPLPFLYNACHGGLLGSGGFNSKSASCKIGLEKGVVTKLEINETLPPAPFSATKVRLKQVDDKDLGSGLQKTTAPELIAAQSKLSVIMNNQCLQENNQALQDQPISLYVAQKGEMLNSLNRQAYEWILDRDYTDQEIESLADKEPCVIGLAWNQSYKMQSLSFDDQNQSLQTHLPAIKAFQAYDLIYGTPGLAIAGSPSVLVAVIDTGVDWQHPDILPNMWVHSQGVGVDATTLKTNLVDFNPYDVSTIGHGTHVSGMIAAAANNGTGIIGAMPYRAKIMGIKVFKADASGNLSTTSTYFYNALQFAYSNGAQVINLSLGSITDGPATDAVAESGVDEAVTHGAVVVTVIGNADTGNGVLIDGTTKSSIPGQYASKSGVIGVGAFDTTTGDKSYFSNYSTTFAEIGAPGEESAQSGLYSTLPTALGSYGRLSGTSQAAPQVSAAAAIVIGMIKNAYNVAPTPAEVERILLASAVKSPQLAPYFKDGNRLDLLQVAQRVQVEYPLTKTGATVNLAQGCN